MRRNVGYPFLQKTFRTKQIYSTATESRIILCSSRKWVANYGFSRCPLLSLKSFSSLDKVKIFRKDMIEGGFSSGKNVQLSVDVSAKKLLDYCLQYDNKRCLLCNETYLTAQSHVQTIPHTGREGMMIELLRPFCGTPEEVRERWWNRLHSSSLFQRIPSLSHHNNHIRKRRLQYILEFLRNHLILRECFNVSQLSQGAGRSWEFERLEFLGDQVVKYIFNNRLLCLFPFLEGGQRGKICNFQFVIDGNAGLARAYDYLELSKLTENSHIVSKFKSDVVETLFGELQLWLVSTEHDEQAPSFGWPLFPEVTSLRALVAHTMDELGHCIFMYHIDVILALLLNLLKTNEIPLIRADPASRDQVELQNNSLQAFYTQKITERMQNRSLSKVPNPRYLSRSHEHTPNTLQVKSRNSLAEIRSIAESFNQVTPVGGLLPCMFQRGTLGVSNQYLAELQKSQSLTENHKKNSFALWSKFTSSLSNTELLKSENDTLEGERSIVGRRDLDCLNSFSSFLSSSWITQEKYANPIDRLKDLCLLEELP